LPKTILEERLTPKTGDYAPDIELPAVTGAQRHKFKLSEFRGKKNVVLAFYAIDWSPT
jgi:peroxiredoxin